MKRKIQRGGIILCLLTVNLLLISLLCRQLHEAFRIYSPVEIKLLNFTPTFMQISDVDGDGNKEIITKTPYPLFGDRNEWSIFRLSSRGYMYSFLGEFLGPSSSYLLKIEVERKKKSKDMNFVFAVVRKDGLYLEKYDNRGFLLKVLPFEKISYKFKKPLEYFSFSSPTIVDLEGDGDEELVGTLIASYRRYPRGIVAFNFKTRKVLWEYYCAPEVTLPYLVEDLNRDGKKEVIFGTFAVNNGAKVGDTDDAHSYLIVLDHRGKEIWRRIMGQWYTMIFVDIEDLDGDGQKEIIASKECHRAKDAEPGELWIFNVSGKLLANFVLNDINFFRPIATQDNERGVIFVGDSNGRLWKFDSKLRILKVVDLGEKVVLINSFKNKEWKYIYALTSNSIKVFTKDLKEIYSYRLKQPVFLGSMLNTHIEEFSSFPQREGVVLVNRPYLIREGGSVSFWKKLLGFLESGAALTFFGLILSNLFLLSYYRATKRRDEEEILSFQSWVEVMQELAHRMRTPLSTLLWSLEKVKRIMAKSPP